MAQIQWYPGHMHKAAREMREVLPGVDVVIELMDARIPYSSANPMLQEIRGNKPGIKLLSKADMADPDWSRRWIDWYRKNQDIQALETSANNPSGIRKVSKICSALFPGRTTPIVAMIAGIPNVGKSTLINILAGRSIAKTGNEPAITKMQQRIPIGDNVVLLDTPGVLWPKVENPHSGYRLAATGAIRETAMSHEDVAAYLAAFLLGHYPDRLTLRYGEIGPEVKERGDGAEILDQIGRYRGCLKSGGRVDTERAARILINDYREGALGCITLETPEMIAEELIELEAERENKEARKAERKSNFKKR